MNDIAIKVENLSKRYRIGLKEGQPETLVAAMTGWLRSPLANYRQLRRLSQFGEDGHDTDDIIWALKDVSFEVKQGEVVGIIGRNGAGKSTLLKILSRITEPTSGRAVINGRVSSLLEVGTGFHPDLTGRENVYLNGTVLGMSKAEVERKFDEIVDFSGVEKFLDTPAKRYSSGMLVRLAFSVAAHLEPEILLVDEVLAVGDAEFQKKCLGKMDEVAKGGRTVLFVSHQMNAVQSLCTHTMILEDGSLDYEGETNDAVRSYLSKYQIEDNNTPLSQRKYREGVGPLRFQSVRFNDANTLQPLQIILSGQKVNIDIAYKSISGKTKGPTEVAINFWSTTGQLMFTCKNDAVNRVFLKLGDRGIITCTIPKWPLPTGIYSYNMSIKVNGVLSDRIRQAGYIKVETGDFYGSGRIPNQAGQGVFIEYDWHATSEEILLNGQ